MYDIRKTKAKSEVIAFCAFRYKFHNKNCYNKISVSFLAYFAYIHYIPTLAKFFGWQITARVLYV